MRCVSLFAGIGGFDLALIRKGHQIVYANEWDKYAAQTYEKNFKQKPDTRDITTIPTSDIPDHDLLVGGFPCQAFSIAGKRRGFAETRGTLFFEIARILKDKKPKYFILENVKGLLSHDNGATFKTIISTLNELGYDLQWQVLNSKNFGVPQNRERVFIIGHLRGTSRPKVFPISNDNTETAKELEYIGGIVGERDMWINDGKQNSRNFSQGQRVYSTNGISSTLAGNAGGLGGKTGLYAVPVLTPDRVEKRQNGRRFKENGDPSFTLTAQDRHGVVVQDGRILNREKANTLDANYWKGIDNHQARTGIMEDLKIRRLTSTECERLQGFPDDFTEGVSDTQRYKQLGNAVTVNVVEEIIKRLCQ